MKLHHSIAFSVALGLGILALGVCSADTISSDTLVKIADTLRAELRTRDQWTYRTALFALFKETHKLTNSDLVARIHILVKDIRSKGADGVDALLIHYVDAAAQRKMDAANVTTTKKALSELRGQVRYVDAHPANIKIPFGRSSTRMVLDVRAEAMQIFLEQLVGFPGMGIPTVDDLLGGKPTTDALCALPAQKDQNGNNLPSEQERQASCASSGKPGGEGGGASGALGGGIAESGCINAHAQDIQQMMQQVRDMEECLEGANAFVNVKVPAFAWVPFAGAVIAGVGFVSAIATIYEAAKAEAKEALDKVNEPYAQAVERYAQEVQEAMAADKIADGKERDLGNAEIVENNAKREQEEAQEAVNNARTEAERQAAQTRLNQAEEEAKKAELARKEAEAEAEEARDTADRETEEAEQAGREAEKARPEDVPPGGEGMRTSEACKRAMGGRDLTTYRPGLVTMDQLRESWKEVKRSWVSHPPPDSDTPFTAVEQPICGLDDATTQGATSSCALPVLCVEGYQPNASCGCSISTGSPKPLQLQCAAMRCADGAVATTVGLVCSCGSTGTNPPKVGFRPPRPLPAAIDAFFATPTQESIDPARVMVNRIMR